MAEQEEQQKTQTEPTESTEPLKSIEQPEGTKEEIKLTQEDIISYLRQYSAKGQTITEKCKSYLEALKEKQFWDVSQKLPFPLQKEIARLSGAKSDESVRYAIKMMQKEAIQKTKPMPPEAEKLKEVKIKGIPKQIPEETIPPQKPEVGKPEVEKEYIQFTQEDVRSILKSFNETIKSVFKTDRDIYDEGIINILSTVDSKLLGSVQIETKETTVSYNTILIIALILHLIPLIPIAFSFISKPKEKEAKKE